VSLPACGLFVRWGLLSGRRVMSLSHGGLSIARLLRLSSLINGRLLEVNVMTFKLNTWLWRLDSCNVCHGVSGVCTGQPATTTSVVVRGRSMVQEVVLGRLWGTHDVLRVLTLNVILLDLLCVLRCLSWVVLHTTNKRNLCFVLVRL